MGVINFFHELKTNVSPKRLFKAFTTDDHHVLPKVSPFIKSVETIQGDGGAGTVKLTTFAEGAHFKNLKTRIDFLDTEKCVAKFTMLEGNAMDKFEKISYEVKFEDSKDGGCVIKITSDYHTKGDVVAKDEDVAADHEQAMAVYKACAEYLVANPHVCA